MEKSTANKEEENIDIDLEAPETVKAAEAIQAVFRGKFGSRKPKKDELTKGKVKSVESDVKKSDGEISTQSGKSGMEKVQIQLLPSVYKQFLNKSHENEVVLRGQNLPLKCYPPIVVYIFPLR